MYVVLACLVWFETMLHCLAWLYALFDVVMASLSRIAARRFVALAA